MGRQLFPHFIFWAGAAFAAALAGATQPHSGPAGEELFEKRCGGCHAIDRDKEGPRLRGVYGRASASGGAFPYSDALKRSKITWTDQTLDRWLTDPDQLVPNNDMTFSVTKADERREIIAYLKQNGQK